MHKIEFLNPTHSFQVAALHIQGIPMGFIRSLGPGLVAGLFDSIAEHLKLYERFLIKA
jgi:hypothetical protein